RPRGLRRAVRGCVLTLDLDSPVPPGAPFGTVSRGGPGPKAASIDRRDVAFGRVSDGRVYWWRLRRAVLRPQRRLRSVLRVYRARGLRSAGVHARASRRAGGVSAGERVAAALRAPSGVPLRAHLRRARSLPVLHRGVPEAPVRLEGRGRHQEVL